MMMLLMMTTLMTRPRKSHGRRHATLLRGPRAHVDGQSDVGAEGPPTVPPQSLRLRRACVAVIDGRPAAAGALAVGPES